MKEASLATATHIVTPEEAAADTAPEAVVVRFAGDSGDGMQLTGGQFTLSTALAGNDLATFPDFPAEIRAPQGTTFGVSAFQINFGSASIETAGDAPDVLVAMNPAALKINVDDLKPGGLIIADEGEFGARNLAKAGYEANPLEDGSLARWQVIKFNISQLTLDAVKPFGLGNKEALRCKNMWTLGLALWMFDRDREPIVEWLKAKFAKKPELAEANIAALNAGHAYGETAEIGGQIPQRHIDPAPAEPGLYRTVTGAEAVSLGLVAGAQLAGLPMFFGGYPITPASAILHHLSRLKEYGVTTFQAEDEIAAIGSAIGAAYAGSLGVTSSSGPGIALKMEAMGLAIMAELPLVIVNSQRGGPSTGLPTKTEQSDLYQAVYGRNADAPLPGHRRPLAGRRLRLRDRGLPDRRPVHDSGDAAHRRLYRQCRRAVEGARHGRLRALPGRASTTSRRRKARGSTPMPGTSKLARVWIRPGSPGLTHRIGGIEKNVGTGHIDYAPANHQAMTDIRADKVLGVADSCPEPGRVPRRGGRQAGGGRLGLDLRPDPPGGAPGARARGRRQPHPHPPHLAAAAATSASCCAPTSGSSSPR